jgi:hypothetical protein
MKRLFLILFLSLSFSVFSQNADSTKFQKFSDRILFGGSFFLWFGTTTNIDISPTVSYLINEKLSAGVGGVYNYYAERNYYNFHIYGAKVFSNYIINENIFVHGEYEILSLPNYFDYGKKHLNEDRFFDTGIYVGGGYRQHISEKSFVSMMILFNLNDNINSFHENPIIRVGFNF